MPAKGEQIYNWNFKDRQEVGRLHYQLRRFIRKCKETSVPREHVERAEAKIRELCLVIDSIKGNDNANHQD